MTIYLMSTTVIPRGALGVWTVESVAYYDVLDHILLYGSTPQQDRLADNVVSAVGHESTAQVMSEVLDGLPIPMNRITVEPVDGDIFYCFALDRRPPEGVILNREELEEIGYSWVRLTYHGQQAEVDSQYCQ